MKGRPVLDDHRHLPSGLPMLLGFLCLPVHHRQIALGVKAPHHETIVKAHMGFLESQRIDASPTTLRFGNAMLLSPQTVAVSQRTDALKPTFVEID